MSRERDINKGEAMVQILQICVRATPIEIKLDIKTQLSQTSVRATPIVKGFLLGLPAEQRQ